MRILLFVHSLISDWNHGNAHFLRGIVSELLHRGHEVISYEPLDAWSIRNLTSQHGTAPIDDFHAVFPNLTCVRYDLSVLDLPSVLDGADLVLVHEWNDPALVRALGALRVRGGGFTLLFHDTHHRSVTDPQSVSRFDLGGYDGVLAFGETVRQVYLSRGWAHRVWTWHEAADVRLFHPVEPGLYEWPRKKGDLVWIGNWGDEERSAELKEYLFEPVRVLKLSSQGYGVRYPDDALAVLANAGMSYRGWLPNFRVPKVFARFSVTVHIPRRPYVEKLRGIPTIRPFEAMACGIPLVCAPWYDTEQLFTRGSDYLMARDGVQMQQHLRDILNDTGMAQELAAHGRATIMARHTCAHRVEQLLTICARLQPGHSTFSESRLPGIGRQH